MIKQIRFLSLTLALLLAAGCAAPAHQSETGSTAAPLETPAAATPSPVPTATTAPMPAPPPIPESPAVYKEYAVELDGDGVADTVIVYSEKAMDTPFYVDAILSAEDAPYHIPISLAGIDWPPEIQAVDVTGDGRPELVFPSLGGTDTLGRISALAIMLNGGYAKQIPVFREHFFEKDSNTFFYDTSACDMEGRKALFTIGSVASGLAYDVDFSAVLQENPLSGSARYEDSPSLSSYTISGDIAELADGRYGIRVCSVIDCCVYIENGDEEKLTLGQCHLYSTLAYDGGKWYVAEETMQLLVRKDGAWEVIDESVEAHPASLPSWFDAKKDEEDDENEEALLYPALGLMDSAGQPRPVPDAVEASPSPNAEPTLPGGALTIKSWTTVLYGLCHEQSNSVYMGETLYEEQCEIYGVMVDRERDGKLTYTKSPGEGVALHSLTVETKARRWAGSFEAPIETMGHALHFQSADLDGDGTDELILNLDPYNTAGIQQSYLFALEKNGEIRMLLHEPEGQEAMVYHTQSGKLVRVLLPDENDGHLFFIRDYRYDGATITKQETTLRTDDAALIERCIGTAGFAADTHAVYLGLYGLYANIDGKGDMDDVVYGHEVYYSDEDCWEMIAQIRCPADAPHSEYVRLRQAERGYFSAVELDGDGISELVLHGEPALILKLQNGEWLPVATILSEANSGETAQYAGTVLTVENWRFCMAAEYNGQNALMLSIYEDGLFSHYAYVGWTAGKWGVL